MKVWTVLPAYNEEENLPALLGDFKKLKENSYNLELHIILINDGSTDNTSAIALSSTPELDIEVYDNQNNMGLAYTFMRGINIVVQKACPEDIIICMDADYSHSPQLIPQMIQKIQEGRDLVIASRYQPGAVVKGVPFFRRFLSFGMSIIFRLIYPIKGVKDYSCGYRAYRAGFLQKALSAKGQQLFAGKGFSCMAGILLSLGKEDAICGEVPIVLRYDQKAGSSKMDVLRTIGQTLNMLIHKRFKNI